MALAYTREFLIDAFVSRFLSLGTDTVQKQRDLANKLYDRVGKDKFRTYASLDAEAIRAYKNR